MQTKTGQLNLLLNPKAFIGRAPERVVRVVHGPVEATLKKYRDAGLLERDGGSILNV